MMLIQTLTGIPSPQQALALADFESQFDYPLGATRFVIRHGEDYLRFYRSLGQACALIAEAPGGVVGVCCASLRVLELPGHMKSSLYLGDLKVAQSARGRTVLWRLARQLGQQATDLQAAWAVVMNGSPVTPAHYTGRAGLPAFIRLGQVSLWRLALRAGWPEHAHVVTLAAADGEALYRHLTNDGIRCLSGDSRLRSLCSVQWFATEDGRACARVEDTRCAKQLFARDGIELVSAHLGAFACQDPRSGQALLETVGGQLARDQYPSLFLTLPQGHGPLPELLASPPAGSITTTAEIYGCGLPTGLDWYLGSSEI